MFPYLRGMQAAHPIQRGVDPILIRYVLVREDEDAYEVFFNAPSRVFLRQKDARSYHASLDNEFAYTIMSVRVNMTSLEKLDAH